MTAPGAPVVESWATREFGLALDHVDSDAGYTVPQLVEPGLRRNPRRAHLLVSTVLGKHLPTAPDVVIAAGDRLGDLVLAALGVPAERESEVDVTVLGFAETATGLGHCVATRMRARCYLHSTRRDVPGARTFAGFEEGHSHATSHLLQPTSPDLLADDCPMILVDDEISTGATAVDAIRALHAHHPRGRYIVASLVDMRTGRHRDQTEAAAADLGVTIDFVSLASGRTVLPEGLIERVVALPDPVLNPISGDRGTVERIELPWPAAVPDGGRHGFLHSDADDFDAAITAAATELATRVDPDHPAVVIGHEELMYLPLRLAAALGASGREVRFQTTTRSPAYVLDEPGYPLRRGYTFVAPEGDDTAARYLYNAHWPDDPAVRPLLIVVADSPADTDRLHVGGGLLDVLTAAGNDVLLAVVPAADPRYLARMRQDPA
ncbi:phosphoribosyltransferase family protein [Rhodococcus sp. TAF43]|uniref:phosphoribosyltransferase family protein n=1 Tax=unclassified Rhodococcus (in: high G+C Gram-positive bacteria) TaxID=192944 RepID=UPI001581A52B|nr:phosphoribosyltransferase family protein [Rhodococcus sp. W8901]QKT11002.1 phosphoribosyltransferase domain-containing protein [Rhodococcus sp. W8901]